MSEIDFNKILKEVEKQPKVEIDWTKTLKVKQIYDSSVRKVYDVIVPKGHEDGIDEEELITRVDNGKHNLEEECGQKCHFGGNVEWLSTYNAIVTVWVD